MELALRHHGVGEVQSVELNLARTVIVQIISRTVHLLQIINEEIIKRTVRHELQRADRMGYTLEVVALSVGKVIHRVAMPFGSEGRGYTGLRGRTLLLGNLLAGLLVDVGMAILNHPDGEVPKLLEIVGSIVDVAPLEAQPGDIVQDVLHILGILLRGVGIVEAQVADAIVLFCYTEVHADGLGMANVQVAVGLWRETRLYASAVLTFGKVLFYELFYEADAFLLFLSVLFVDGHIL